MNAERDLAADRAIHRDGVGLIQKGVGGYVADWDDMPEWQRETDADIFERIEQGV
ncbi:hypothetical protein ACFVJS_13380 [Nocardioides sp. NPDC057772]|uniref:hypothetical protein n=1 Tax=Nocardioides sp. NPDC057772 TaxID=3346245 RepID=UPI00367309F7